MALLPSYPIGRGTQKLYEVSAEKGTDTFTYDSTYKRYICTKTFGSSDTLLSYDDIWVEMIQLGTNQNSFGMKKFKLSDESSNTGGQKFFTIEQNTGFVYGATGFEYIQFMTQTSTHISATFIIGEALYAVLSGVKAIIYV